jgi:hypothetical protein
MTILVKIGMQNCEYLSKSRGVTEYLGKFKLCPLKYPSSEIPELNSRDSGPLKKTVRGAAIFVVRFSKKA